MTLNVNSSQPNFCAVNNEKNKDQSDVVRAGWIGMAAGEVVYCNRRLSNAKPNQYLENLKYLKENLGKISQDVIAKSNDSFQSARIITENELGNVKTKDRSLLQKISDNKIDEAKDALKNLDGVKIELKEGASDESKRIVESINNNITKLVETGKKSPFLRGLGEQKYAVLGGIICSIGVALYKRLNKDASESSKSEA